MNPVNGDLYVYDRVDSNILRFKENGEVEVFENYLKFNPDDIMSWMQISPDGKYLFFSTGRFGSDVIVVDIETKEVIYDYTFRPERSMIGASQIVSKDLTLYKMGGYGYWDFRNIMLEWSFKNPAWEAVEVVGDKPSRGDPPYLFYLEELNQLYYIVNPMQENSSNPEIKKLEFYQFDLSDKKWEKTGEIEFEEAFTLPLNFQRATRSQADSPDLLHINGNVFLNRKDLRFYSSDLDFFKVVKGPAVFYSDRLGKRILMAEANSSGLRELFIRVVDEKDLKLIPVPIKKPDYTIWIVIGAVLVSLGIAGFTFYRFRQLKHSSDVTSTLFVIQKDANQAISLLRYGEKISLSDPNMKRLWELIYKLKKENQSEIYLSDLDQHLFLNSSNAALNSRTRGKLFKVMEDMAGESIITIEQSPTDKRYKIVRFNLRLIKIVESD
jgi:hypothetical protein